VVLRLDPRPAAADAFAVINACGTKLRTTDAFARAKLETHRAAGGQERLEDGSFQGPSSGPFDFIRLLFGRPDARDAVLQRQHLRHGRAHAMSSWQVGREPLHSRNRNHFIQPVDRS